MNSAIFRTLAALCLITLGSVCIIAQSPLEVTIPFDFTIGTKSFAAGKYSVRPQVSPSILAIQGVDGGSAGMALTHAVQAIRPSGGTRLVFNRYGNNYFLSQVWTSGYQGATRSNRVRQRYTSPPAVEGLRCTLCIPGRSW